VGGWWSLMSGAMSIPFAFLALIFGGKSAVWFALLAVAASWVMIVRMAYANYKKMEKDRIKRILGEYYASIDTKIKLLFYYKKAGELKKAGDLMIESGELFDEIREFIKKEIGPMEANIFHATSDCDGMIKDKEKGNFYDSVNDYLKSKMLKLKKICEDASV
jgi:hypothetical protein